ncbi:ankyrin [Trichodelitschia bisporula]|uniref:Ankyrin n=1 Tax=Trichodelitschia bisporula TaxID=703511 RepID=A0A6G1HWT1_9PEZI|nr:ankyrin [Trichodelitschia bisporula]
MADPGNPPPATTSKPDPSQLPPEALDLAHKIFDLARNGDTAAVASYVDAGISANLTNDAGDTLLMLAAYHGHAETVTLLLERGADPNSLNDKGQSPIAGAVFKGHTEVVKALVKGGADSEAGRPSAADAAKIFKRDDLLKIIEEGKQPETG